MRPAPPAPREWLFLVLALALACAGCPSFSTLQTPRTVPDGELRLAAIAGAAGALSDEAHPGPSAAQFELSARYGLSDRVDIGAKLYALGVEAGIKWLMLRGPLDLAIAPALSFASFNDPTSGTSFNAFYAHLPLLIGWNVSERVTLSFGPKLLFGYQFRSGDVVRDDLLLLEGMLVGLYVSVPIRIARAFWIAPELNAYVNVTNGAVGSVTIYHGGLAFMFGGPEPTLPPDEDDEADDAGDDATRHEVEAPAAYPETAPAPPSPEEAPAGPLPDAPGSPTP